MNDASSQPDGASPATAPAADSARREPASPDARWVAFVSGEDRTGTLTAVTGVFSSRGVSFDSLATGDRHEGAGTMSIVFMASARLARVLVRTLERLAAVRSVHIERADDPGVRAVGVIRLTAGAGFDIPDDAELMWSQPGGHCGDGRRGDGAAITGGIAPGQPLLVEGPMAAVERVLTAARAAGAVLIASVILPPERWRD